MQNDASPLQLAVDNSAQAQRPSDLARRRQCSERTVRNLISTGALPAFKLGGKLLRVSLAAVERFEQCQSIDSSAFETNLQSLGQRAVAAFDTRSALIAARKPISDSLAS
jgi:excisionase family DNA binding protein